MKCINCKAELKDNLGYHGIGETLYQPYIDGENLAYKFCEVLSEDEGSFYCKKCGKNLSLTKDMAKKILKGEDYESIISTK